MNLMIEAKISGLTDGEHGFHIHQGRFDPEVGCGSSGGHFNDPGLNSTPGTFDTNFIGIHGANADADNMRHVGDLIPLTATSGVATYNESDRLADLDLLSD